MAGMKKRSGGGNRKPVQLHQIAGTWRRDRHGSGLQSATAPIAAPSESDAALFEGLGEAGQRFLAAAHVEYEFGKFEAHVLRLAAHGFDDHAAARSTGDLKDARASCRQILACLQRLNLPVTERL